MRTATDAKAPVQARSLWRDGTLDEMIRAHTRACLDAHCGNVRATAEALGVSHTRVMRILRTRREGTV